MGEGRGGMGEGRGGMGKRVEQKIRFEITLENRMETDVMSG